MTMLNIGPEIGKKMQRFFILILGVCLICCDKGNYVVRQRYSDPQQTVVDMNKEVAETEYNTLRILLKDKTQFTLDVPKDIFVDVKDVVKIYEVFIQTIEQITGVDWKADIHLIVISQKKYPKNYKYTSPRFHGFVDCVVLSPDSRPMIEKLCDHTAHEMLHFVIPSHIDVKKNYSGWFEEGLANYVSLRCAENLKIAGVIEEKNDALKAFGDDEIRTKLWQWYGYYEKDMTMPVQSAKTIAGFWEPIDKGYRAALGAFLYYENVLGREKLERVIKTILSQQHKTQNEHFYHQLEVLTGIEIREVKSEEMRQLFKKEIR